MFEQVVKVEHVRESGLGLVDIWMDGFVAGCGWFQAVGGWPGLACASLIPTATGNLRGGVTKQFYLSCPRNGGLDSASGGGSGGGAPFVACSPAPDTLQMCCRKL